MTAAVDDMLSNHTALVRLRLVERGVIAQIWRYKQPQWWNATRTIREPHQDMK